MVNWQIVATTIFCDAIGDEVTLLVNKDWSAKCTGYRKYGKPNKEILNLLKRRSKQLKQRLECTGPLCHRVVQYKEKLFAEETKKRGSETSEGEKAVPPQRDRE